MRRLSLEEQQKARAGFWELLVLLIPSLIELISTIVTTVEGNKLQSAANQKQQELQNNLHEHQQAYNSDTNLLFC